MATVERVVTVTTVTIVAFSVSRLFGNTLEIASAADAPQIPTEPPLIMPNARVLPNARASNKPADRDNTMPPLIQNKMS